MLNFKTSPELILFAFILLFSLFFRIKIIHELPLGLTTTVYGLQGFDDEPAHLNYSKYLLKHQSFPVETSTISDIDAFTKNEFEYHQPPLYYIIISTLSGAFDLSSAEEQLVLGRYFNLFISLISAFLAYLIFIQLGWHRYQSLIGCSFILLMGSHVYQTSLFSNDALSWLIIWAIFLFILKGSIQNWLKITLLLIFAHYTKSNILVIYPVLLWSFFKAYSKGEEQTFKNALLILIIPLLVAAPWYYRNYILYNSFFHLSGSEWYFVANFLESAKRIIHAPYSFLFKMHFLPPKKLISLFNYLQYATVFPLIAAGIWKLIKKFQNDFHTQILIIMFFIMIAAYLVLAIPTGFTEGRMLFPALPVIVYLIFQPTLTFKKHSAFQEYFMLILVCFLMMPSFIIGFYF